MEEDLNSLECKTASSFSELNEEDNQISPIEIIANLEKFSSNETDAHIQHFTHEERKKLLIFNRTYYMNEMDRIERYINSIENMKDLKKMKKEEKKLIFCFNKLSNNEKLYINLQDYYKSLNLQKRIVIMLKKYIINTKG